MTLTGQPRPPVAALLHKAASDEAVLAMVLISDSILGFHAQQAVEKLLKALLMQLLIRYERSHDLEKLCRLLKEGGETLPSTPLSFSNLTNFAVEYRYDFLPDTIVVDRLELAETVRILREFVMRRITALTAQP